MWNWVRYFGVEYVKTLMDSSQSQSIASENKSFSSSVSSGTDAPNSSEGVTCKAQFRSSEPLSVSVVLAKKKILKVLEEGSSDVSKVSFCILRSGKLGIDTNCSTTAVILRAVPFLEEIGRQCKGVCYLEASQSCTEAEILEELQQGNETITNVEKLKGNTCIITFATSIPSFILYFSGRCDVKSYYSSPYRCRKCQAFGHLGTRCKQKARCGNCSQLGHFEAYCTNAANCRTCRAPHRPDSVRCPRWQQEIRIKKHMASTGVTYTLAKQEVNVSGPRSSVVGGASAASKPPSLKPTWAKVAAKSVGTMRPKNVATQTKCFSSVGSQCPDQPVLTAEISTQTESSESATPELQEVSVQSETAVLVVEPSMVGGQQSVESVEAVLPHSVSMPSLSCDGVTPIRGHMFSQDSIYSPQHEMEYTSASTRRKRCDSAESQDNPKKFAASSDCSYSPPPAAKPFKINRQFGNSQVDGIDDDDLSVSGGEFLAECSPFLVDRCVFSMGSGDEGDGHLDDHDLLSAASCETVQGDISGCSGVEEAPSPSSASLVVEDVSIQSVPDGWTVGEGCTNCRNFLERRFEEASWERKTWFFNRDRPCLYGHTSAECPFLDLRGRCGHCGTPGSFLNSGIHYYAMKEEECLCCDECHYSQFVKGFGFAIAIDDSVIKLMVIAEMAPDPKIPLTDGEYEDVYHHLEKLIYPDSDDSD